MKNKSNIVLFLAVSAFWSCEETKDSITANPDAIATFSECIPIAIELSNSIRIDTAFTELVRTKLQLARTVDVELEGIHPFDCRNYHMIEVYFDSTIDSAAFMDSCRTQISSFDLILDEYGFDSCYDDLLGGFPEERHGFSFSSLEKLNIPFLVDSLHTLDGIDSAIAPILGCTFDFPCQTIDLGISEGVFTFTFSEWCDFETRTDWIVVVTDDHAILVEKTAS